VTRKRDDTLPKNEILSKSESTTGSNESKFMTGTTITPVKLYWRKNGTVSSNLRSLGFSANLISMMNRKADERELFMVHAEMNALSHCSVSMKHLKDGLCFVTLMPCPQCIKTIINTGIKYIIFLHDYGKYIESIEMAFEAGVALIPYELIDNKSIFPTYRELYENDCVEMINEKFNAPKSLPLSKGFWSYRKASWFIDDDLKADLRKLLKCQFE
jgi:deoxycytidylate deaminase